MDNYVQQAFINRFGGEQQTYSVLEIHVDTPDGDHVRSARVELTYNGESNLANTDNKGIAVFYGVPTGTEISYTITAAGYNAATGKWIIPIIPSKCLMILR